MFDNSSTHCLVGRFFTTLTPPSLDETEKSIRQRWNLSNDMLTVKKQAESDTFVFEFRQEKDKEEVLDNGPINVNGVILVIKDLDTPDMIDFTVTTLDVVVVGLPPYLNTEEYLPTLKSHISDNYSVLISNYGEIIRLIVEVNLKKPLRAGFFCSTNRFVQLMYINLGDFCYKCGMIGHVERYCDFRFHKERALNATSTTHVYGPWLRASSWEVDYYRLILKKTPGKQNECEKTLTYAQFFIELEFNEVVACSPKFESETESTHRFRFPCSYLGTETECTDSTTSKAYEVVRKEIYENLPFPDLGDFLGNRDLIGNVVEHLKFVKENWFCCDDKWLSLNLQINRTYNLMHVDYETILAVNEDRKCERLIDSKISDLIKKRVAMNEDLLSLLSWENQIIEVTSEIGLSTLYIGDVSVRAHNAMTEAIQIEISSSGCPKPADKSTVSELERFRVLGSNMDQLDPCVICVGEMFLAEEATVLPCSHVFHSSCIEKWLQVGHKCPLCGFKLLSQK